MSVQIVPTINSGATKTGMIYKTPTTEHVVGYATQSQHCRCNPFYRVKPPVGIYVSEIAEQKIPHLRDNSVQKQASELVQLIQDILERDYYSESNRLPRLHLVEEEGGSVLIEWNFEHIRVGFSIESDRDKSFFYVVSFRKDDERYDSKSRRLWANIKDVPAIVNLAIQNS